MYPEGRRVEKEVDEDVERYVRSRMREAEGSHRLSNNPGDGGRYDMSHVVSVYDGSNNWLQSFAWNDEVDGIQVLEQADVLDYDTDGNTVEITRSFYHRNALGSVMEITDMNEATVVSYRYDPYGKVTITRGGQTQNLDPLGQHWTFTGRFNDEESGLYYYRARSYDPNLGRFTQRDPLGYSAGPNLYSYVRLNPVFYRDPAGLYDPDDPEHKDPRGAYYQSDWCDSPYYTARAATLHEGLSLFRHILNAAKKLWDEINEEDPFDAPVIHPASEPVFTRKGLLKFIAEMEAAVREGEALKEPPPYAPPPEEDVKKYAAKVGKALIQMATKKFT